MPGGKAHLQSGLMVRVVSKLRELVEAARVD